MKVFVSWSGNPSKNVALILRKYLRRMIQRLDVFVSEHDIAAGDRWERRLADQLEKTDFGILCLSPESLHEDWLLFEAGALAKMTEGRACGLLIGGLGHTDVTGPLSQFQNIKFDRDGFRKLLVSINDKLTPPLDTEQLDTGFDACWPRIDAEYQEALKSSDSGTSTQPERSERDLLEEVLMIVRNITQKTGSEAPSLLEQSLMRRNYKRLSEGDQALFDELARHMELGEYDQVRTLAEEHPSVFERLIAARLVGQDSSKRAFVRDLNWSALL